MLLGMGKNNSGRLVITTEAQRYGEKPEKSRRKEQQLFAFGVLCVSVPPW
jgi:hypothetical protein